jgi:hypothetical protein
VCHALTSLTAGGIFLLVVAMAFWGSSIVAKEPLDASDLGDWAQLVLRLTHLFKQLVLWRSQRAHDLSLAAQLDEDENDADADGGGGEGEDEDEDEDPDHDDDALGDSPPPAASQLRKRARALSPPPSSALVRLPRRLRASALGRLLRRLSRCRRRRSPRPPGPRCRSQQSPRRRFRRSHSAGGESYSIRQFRVNGICAGSEV